MNDTHDTGSESAETPEAVEMQTATAVGDTDSETDVPPDHLSVNPRSEFFSEDVLRRGVGIRFKGRERRDIEEYSISEGWVRVQAGKTVDRKGVPLTIKLSGPVEAWYEDLGEHAPVARA